MPLQMNNVEWMRTIANASRAEGVWSQVVSSHSGTVPIEVPEAGEYQVILVKMATQAEAVVSQKPRISDFIGYGRKFNPAYRSTAEVMKELREGEDE